MSLLESVDPMCAQTCFVFDQFSIRWALALEGPDCIDNVIELLLVDG